MVQTEPATYEAFRVEKRGVDLIPENERHMTPWGLFWLWAGGIWNVEFLVYGALIMSFGLSFGQAVLAIVVGNAFYLFLGLLSLQGPATGTTALMVSRAPFGQNGNRLVAFFNWITQVGFEVEGLALIVLVTVQMFHRGGVNDSTGLKAGIIIVAVAVQFVVPFLGHATITKVLRWLAVVFIALFAIMAILVVPHVNLAHVHQHASWSDWTTALVLLVSAGGLGWTENGNDYSRYLPPSTPRSKTFWAATLGGAVPSIALELLGAAAFVVSPTLEKLQGAGTPQVLNALPTSFASWFFWPFLILAVPQLFAINTLDLYSSGVTLQALGVPVKRWGAVVIDTVVAGILTAIVIFTNNFVADLAGFLNYIVIWLAPWFGVVLVDYLLRRGLYHPPSLATGVGGVYWRNGGANWRALVALAVGGAAALMWTNALYNNPSYIGPFSSRTNGADLSWVLGIVVGGVLYAILAARSVGVEVALGQRGINQSTDMVGTKAL